MAKKYATDPKKVQMKVVQNQILYKKVRERMCLSRPGVELGVSKD